MQNLYKKSQEYAIEYSNWMYNALIYRTLKIFLIFIISLTIISWMIISSIGIYALFYWYYIPTHMHTFPVYFDYSLNHIDSTYNTMNIMLPNYGKNMIDIKSQTQISTNLLQQPGPKALVRLTTDQWSLKSHNGVTAQQYEMRRVKSKLDEQQGYNVHLDLNVRNDKSTRKMGVIMIKMDLLCQLSKNKMHLVASSTRPLVIPYENFLIRWAKRLFWFWPTFFGLVNDNKLISVQMYEHYFEDSTCRTAYVNISLSKNAQHLRIIDATTRFQVQYSGLKYLMYHWFYTTASIFIFQLFTLQLCCILILVAIYFSQVDRDFNNNDDSIPDFYNMPQQQRDQLNDDEDSVNNKSESNNNNSSSRNNYIDTDEDVLFSEDYLTDDNNNTDSSVITAEDRDSIDTEINTLRQRQTSTT